MAIPDFQTLMRPQLALYADGKEHTNQEVINRLGEQWGLSEAELLEKLPSGYDFIFRNRVAWGRTHMAAAGFLKRTRRGVFQITREGQDALAAQSDRIDLKFLQTIEAYRASKLKQKSDSDAPEPDGSDGDANPPSPETPSEKMEAAYQAIRQSLAKQILDQLKSASPSFFERVVVDVLVKMGYGGTQRDAGRAIGRSGDEGIDGIINEDRLGLDVIYIQAKKWEATISRPEIQKFAGALQGKRAKKGIFITTSDFSSGAKDFAASIESRIILIDGATLANHMIDHDVGVTMEALFAIKRLDSDYFAED